MCNGPWFVASWAAGSKCVKAVKRPVLRRRALSDASYHFVFSFLRVCLFSLFFLNSRITRQRRRRLEWCLDMQRNHRCAATWSPARPPLHTHHCLYIFQFHASCNMAVGCEDTFRSWKFVCFSQCSAMFYKAPLSHGEEVARVVAKPRCTSHGREQVSCQDRQITRHAKRHAHTHTHTKTDTIHPLRSASAVAFSSPHAAPGLEPLDTWAWNVIKREMFTVRNRIRFKAEAWALGCCAFLGSSLSGGGCVIGEESAWHRVSPPMVGVF